MRTALELNGLVRRRGYWPFQSMVYGLTAMRPRDGKPPLVNVYLCESNMSPGIVAHELAHVLFFCGKALLGISGIGKKAVRRKGSDKMFADKTEEWFCHSLQTMVNMFYTRRNERQSR